MLFLKYPLFVFLTLVIFTTLNAQESDNSNKAKQALPPLETDRPDQTESSSVIPQNRLQIESGVVLEFVEDETSEINNYSLGGTLLRFGLWGNFELRLSGSFESAEGKVKSTGQDTIISGIGPLAVGFKVHVVEEKGLRPQLAIMSDITLRHIGHEAYAPVYSFPTAKILASHTVTERLSIGYNAGFAYNGSNADGFFVYSFVLGYNLIGDLSVYGEAYGNFDNGDLPNHKIDGGFTYLLSPDFQLDISGGTGFDDKIDKSFISAGFSWRI